MNLSTSDPNFETSAKGAAKLSFEKLAYQRLRAQIIRGEFLPGTLLSENELADQLNMSRTPIRAAISLLETEGFLESIRGRGVFVKDISFREFRELYEVLVSLQLFSLEAAAMRKLAFDLSALRGHLDRQIQSAETDDYLTYYECSLLFAESMVATIGNKSMLQIFDKLKGKYMFKIVSYRIMNADTLPKPKHAKQLNIRICDALERGDFEGAKQALHEINELVNKQLQHFEI
jgi:DNA-binding GntR family transcriptional regulator